jgi:type I restriction enzyme S subunit
LTSGVLSLGAEHISGDGRVILREPRYVPVEYAESMKRGRVQGGDVLLVKDGATTGRAALVDEATAELRPVVNEHVFVLRPEPEADSEFLAQLLLSPPGKWAVLKNFHGAAQGGITKEFLAKVLVAAELDRNGQRAIARRATTRSGPVILLSDRVSQAYEAAEQLRYSLVDAALASVPSPDGTFADVLEHAPETGWSPREDPAGDVPVFSLSAVLHFRFDADAIKMTSAKTGPEASYWAQRDDVLITRSNTPMLVGHAAVYRGAPPRVIVPDLMFRLRFATASPDFVVLWLMTAQMRNLIIRSARGSSGTMKKITKELILALPFPRQLSLDDQRSFVEAAASTAKPAERLIEALRSQRSALHHLWASTLTQEYDKIVKASD